MKVRCVEFAAEPKYLLTGGDDKIIKLYTLYIFSLILFWIFHSFVIFSYEL